MSSQVNDTQIMNNFLGNYSKNWKYTASKLYPKTRCSRKDVFVFSSTSIALIANEVFCCLSHWKPCFKLFSCTDTRFLSLTNNFSLHENIQQRHQSINVHVLYLNTQEQNNIAYKAYSTKNYFWYFKCVISTYRCKENWKLHVLYR